VLSYGVGVKIESFALERWMTHHEMHVTYDIAESGICPLRVADLLAWEAQTGGNSEATLDALLDLPLGYSEARGSAALRSAIAATYADCDADRVLVTTGAIEANYLLFNVLLEAGDHVIAPFPAYQQLYSVPRALGCDVSLWEVGPSSGYRFDMDALERLIRPTTRLIVVNTPHNPTGAMLTPAEVDRVYALAESVGATVLGDEAYRWLTVPGGAPFAALTHRLDRGDARDRGGLLGCPRLHLAESRQAQ
jgi:aspartate/methionine/tyrosine aminotransferase